MFGKQQNETAFLGEIIGQKYANPAQIMLEKLYKFEYNTQLGGKKKETEEHRRMLVDEIRKTIDFPDGYTPKTLKVALSHCDFSRVHNLHSLFDCLVGGLKYNMPEEVERRLFALKVIDTLENKNQLLDSDYLSDQFSKIASFPEGFNRLESLENALHHATYELNELHSEREGDAIVCRNAYEKTALILADFVASEKVIQELAEESQQSQNM